MMQEIAKHYVEKVIPSAHFLSNQPCDAEELLYPPFLETVKEMISEYNSRNTDNDVPVCFETFRSHARQSYYYSVGSSKIRGGNLLNAGMHHLTIAVDLVNLDDKNNNNKRDRGERVDWTNLNYGLFREMSEKYEVNFLSWEECHFQMIGTNQQRELRVAVFDYVKNWQWKHGLVSDGIVGGKTIAKAKELYP